MFKRGVVAAVLGLLTIGPVWAQQVGGPQTQGLIEARNAASATGRVSWYRGEYVECAEKPSTAEIVDCINGLARQWDARLNAAYSALMASLPPEQKVRLQSAEREWLQYRNVNCDYYLNSGGTIANVRYAECRRVMTAQRAIELETASQP